MSIQGNSQNDLERERIVRDTICALHSVIWAVNRSIQEIVYTGKVPTMDTFHPVQQFRESAQTLAASSRHIVNEKSDYGNAMRALEKRMYQKLQQHDFYIQRGSIQNREKIITSLADSTQQSTKIKASPIWRLVNPIFLRFGYDRAKTLRRKELQNQIRRIITEIWALIENPYFEKMNAESRETYQLKWKQNVEKARMLGIELPDSPSL